jgi:hypothetical protein
MLQKVEHPKAKFAVGSVVFAVGFVAVSVVLFQKVESTGIHSLLGNYAGYVLAPTGFAAMLFGVILIGDAWNFWGVLRQKHKSRSRSCHLPQSERKRLSTMLPTKVADRKTVVLKPRLNREMVKQLGEDLKCNFFTKIGFLKPKPEDVEVISIEKHYEPYLIVGGRYAVDYCKKRLFNVRVDERAGDIAFFGKTFEPKPLHDQPHSTIKAIEFEGEVCSHREHETYFVLDKMGDEVPSERLPLAPREEPYTAESTDLSTIAEDIGISCEEEVDFLRSRIVNRPSEGEITREIFEVNDRALVYSPIYQLTVQNARTKEKVTVKIDGITAEIVAGGHTVEPEARPLRDSLEVHMLNPPTAESRLLEEKEDLPESTAPRRDACADSPRMSSDETRGEFPARTDGEDFTVEDNAIIVAGDLEIPSGATIHQTLVVKGRLGIGDDCQIKGKVKALRDITLGTGTEIEGNVISRGNIVIGPDSVIHGSVESKGHVEIGENSLIEGGLLSESSVALNRFARVYARE